MKDFLIKNNYKLYGEEKDEFGTTQKYQKRVDADYPEYPLCACNDKLFINIDFYAFTIGDINSRSASIFLVHENNKGEWCDIKIYALKETDVLSKLYRLELKVMDMWKVFYEGI